MGVKARELGTQAGQEEGTRRQLSKAAEAGMVGVGDLARRHSLSADLMRKVLSERIGTIVEGRMEGGLLYTPGYVARLTAQLRGAMRAALTPTTRDALVTNALVSDTPAGAELTGSIITDLSKKQNNGGGGGGGGGGGSGGERGGGGGSKGGVGDFIADGVFRGGAWHPAVYSRAQTAAVADVYARAGIVTVDEARRMGVDKASQKKYFKDLDPTCVALDACFVSKATLAGCIRTTHTIQFTHNPTVITRRRRRRRRRRWYRSRKCMGIYRRAPLTFPNE